MSKSDSTIVITGATSGIGLGLAEAFLAEGWNVVGTGRVVERLQATAERLNAGGRFLGVAGDVGRPEVARDVFAQATARYGHVDVLVNNAGIFTAKPFVEFTPEEIEENISTNLKGVLYASQEAAKHMSERKRGKIINICSVTSELGRPTIVPYTTTKGAVKMMTRGLAAELGRHNIQVNGIGPGYIETELNTALISDKAFSSWVESRTPAGRWGKVEELVGAAIFLASPASNYVNGHILYVDGGMTASV